MKRKDFDRDKFILETWPEALESGEFQQAHERLYDKHDNAYCCLGVACELLTREGLITANEWHDKHVLPNKLVELLGIDDQGDYTIGSGKNKGAETSLAHDNDTGSRFPMIAKKIRSIHRRKRWTRDKDDQ